MEIIKNILNSNLINRTLLKNCQYYKVYKYNSNTIHNFTFAELEAFKQKNNIVYYYITKPSAQKAAKVQNTLLNVLSFICFTTALIILITL